jgi:hypothetical protein
MGKKEKRKADNRQNKTKKPNTTKGKEILLFPSDSWCTSGILFSSSESLISRQDQITPFTRKCPMAVTYRPCV